MGRLQRKAHHHAGVTWQLAASPAPGLVTDPPVTTPCHVDTSPRKDVNSPGVGYSMRMWLFQANSMRLVHRPCATLMMTRQRMGTEEASVLRGGCGQGRTSGQR